MKAGKPVTINVNVDWRVLLIALIGAALIIAASSGVLAQDDGERTINDGAGEAAGPPPPIAEATEVVPPPGAESGDLLPTINGEWVERESLGSAERAPEAPGAVASTSFYLTANNYNTNTALTACASGYHMASLWEMADPSNLIYADDHPAAYTRADSGSGPPSGWNGWVRTGGLSSGNNVAGSGNCLAWSTINSGSYGTTVKLANAWESAPGDIVPWDATSYSCALTGPVWCIGD